MPLSALKSSTTFPLPTPCPWGAWCSTSWAEGHCSKTDSWQSFPSSEREEKKKNELTEYFQCKTFVAQFSSLNPGACQQMSVVESSIRCSVTYVNNMYSAMPIHEYFMALARARDNFRGRRDTNKCSIFTSQIRGINFGSSGLFSWRYLFVHLSN